MNNLYFEIVLPDYRANYVSEIWYENDLICEIIKEKDVFEIVFFDKNIFFEIEFDLFMQVVTEAKEALHKRLNE